HDRAPTLTQSLSLHDALPIFGGDWYDVVSFADVRVVLVVGDVSGRGIEAATVMASLRHGIRAFASQGDDPATILGKLCRLVSIRSEEHTSALQSRENLVCRLR